MTETSRHRDVPRFARWLLERIIDPDICYSALGDFDEFYTRVYRKRGAVYARFWYWLQVIKSIPAFLCDTLLWSITMFKSYLVIVLRNTVKHKVYSSINILGLSIGLACSILIYLFISDELSYDRFHKNADSIYGVICYDHFHGDSGIWSTIAMGPVLKDYFPEIDKTVRMNTMNTAIVRSGEKLFNERPLFTDPEFCTVFSFDFVTGDPETALLSNNSVVLTQRMAKKYFGENSPLGRSINMSFSGYSADFSVTGVTSDIPGNSSIRYDFLLNINNLKFIRGEDYLSNWRWGDTKTFITLNKGAAPQTVEERFPQFVNQYYVEKIAERRKSQGGDKEIKVYRFSLMNIKDLHLDPSVINIGATDIKSSLILAGIGLLILVVACINYINLSVGGASKRALEIGLRKVFGARRKQLIRQFWSESSILVLISMIIGVILVFLILPQFSSLSGKNLSAGSILTFTNIFIFMAIAAAVVIISGSFPAMLMAGFHPVSILKGKFRIGGNNSFLRFLVVLQFSLSIFLIISTLTMTDQINFMRNNPMGFDNEGLVVIQNQESNWLAGRKTAALVEKYRNQIIEHSSVINITGSTSSFSRRLVSGHFNINNEAVDVYFNTVYYDFLETSGIELVEGRDFSRNFRNDSNSILVNEKFVEYYGLETPIGSMIKNNNEGDNVLTIIGVVNDFNFRSLKSKIAPLILSMNPEFTLNHIVVRITGNNIPETIALLEKTWKDLEPDKPFLFSFVEDDIETAYNRQKKWNAIVRYSSILALVISCLGIFGLTTIAVSRRIKEIGIRKTLGASIPGILNLLLKEYVLIILAANMLAWPIAYFVMNSWLSEFAYRTSLGWPVFLLSGILTLSIAACTVGFLALKAARTNPVESIRYE